MVSGTRTDTPDSQTPTLLRWTDPEGGEVLWVEMWGTREFVQDLVAQGFEVRRVEDQDESASSLCVRILQSPEPPPLSG